MKKKSNDGYNERLFSNGLRGVLHTARFKWVAKSLSRLKCDYRSIIELGCFDGKVISYLPEKPDHYLGLDANWEGGLQIAENKWSDHSNYVFKQCTKPEDMQDVTQTYDISICMETLEHIPPDMVSPYLEKLSSLTKGYIFITVPNEIGAVFFFKNIIKRLFGDVQKYTLQEFFNQVLGKTDNVERNEHKGFNYNKLVNEISVYFDIVEVSGNPLSFAPTSLNFGIGIIGKSRL